MSGQVLQIGLLGCGAIAQYAHIPAFARARQVRLVALCERAEDLLDAMGRRTGVSRLYPRYDDLLSDPQVEAVLVAVRDELHVAMAMQALRAGKHVLVEKPMGLSSGECNDLLQLVQQTGLKLQVGSNKRHDPGVSFARDFIVERGGVIFSVSGIYRDSIFRSAMQESCLDPLIRGTPPAAALASAAPDPRADREQYNLWTQGAHLFDNLRFLAGNVTAVTAQVARLSGHCAWHGLLELSGGGRGHFELVCKSCGDWWEQYTVYGETASVDVQVSLPFYHRPAQVRAFDGQSQQWSHPLGGHSNAYVNQLEHFADSVLNDHPTSPDAADGLAAVKLLEAVSQSIRSGTRVQLA